MTLAASAETAYVAPRTPIEEELARIWCELLQLERVGVHDNFFELGGHSLLGTQMMSRIHSALQARLPLQTLFEHPTVAGLSLEVINLKTEKTASQAIEDLLSELEEITDEEALTKAKTRQSDTNTQ
jgi:acyl carrier protein